MRAQVSDPRAGGTGIMDLLLLLPDLTVLLMRLLRDDRVPLGAKAIGVLGLSYVLSPLDWIPEIFLGPFGLVDDLLIISAALSRMLNDVHPDVVRHHWPGKNDALEALQRVSDWADEQIVGNVRRAVGWVFSGSVRP